MSSRTFKLAVFVVVAAMVASIQPVQAQQGQGGRGGFRSRGAEIACDILVLNAEKSAKVVAAYEETSTQIREKEMEGKDFQNMSREERMELTTKIQKDTAAKLKETLKEVLSEKELEALEPALSRRVFMPDPELRGLRMIDLKDEQREKIQPLAIKLGESMVAPSFPGAPQDADREAAQKKFAEEKTAFLAKVGEILDADQKTAWATKTDEVKKENEAMMERIRNRNR